ncbi:MAG: MDR family MFS transporter [Deinococcales bacterium]
MSVPAFSASQIPQLTQQQKIFTLIGAFLGVLLAALDQTIVATAGPSIQADLNIEASLFGWVSTAYLVSSTVMVPIYGKLSDLFGRKPILLIGIGIFLLGSALCGISSQTWEIIAARAVQGLGSAALFTSALAIIADMFPPSERGKYSGLFGAVFGLSSVVGPLVGGFLTDNWSWHWVFFVNLPIGALALVFIVSKMPNLNLVQNKPTIDYLGALTLLLATIPLLLALSLGKTEIRAGETGFLWGSPEILGMFAFSVLGLAVFIFAERRAKDPLLDLKLFSSRAFSIANLAAFVIGMGFLGAIVFLPIFMQNVVGLSATASGFAGLPLVIGLVIGNIVSGQLVSRFGRYKPLMLVGLMIMMLGFAIAGFTLTAQSTFWEVFAKMLVMGMGLGPSIPLYTLAIQSAAPMEKIGVATSTATFFRQMGSSVGLAIFFSIFGNLLAQNLAPRLEAATKDLPASMRSQFSNQSGGVNAEGGNSLRFDAEGIKKTALASIKKTEQQLEAALLKNDIVALKALAANQQMPAEIHKQLEAAVKAGGFWQLIEAQNRVVQNLVVKALRDDDSAAKAALLQNPQVPQQLKTLLQNGSIAAQVRAGFDAQYKQIAAAMNSGDKTKVVAVAKNPQLPAALQAQLLAIPAAVLTYPELLAPILAGIKAGMDAAVPQAISGATNAALAQLAKNQPQPKQIANNVYQSALQNLEQTKTVITTAIDKVGTAFKEVLTDSITTIYKLGILVALLAFLMTLVLPEIPLRKSNVPVAAE